jgi:hypothetical protein
VSGHDILTEAAISIADIDSVGLFDDWDWLVPHAHSPLMIGHFGDAVFGAPDGSLWLLDLLEGRYGQIAHDSGEFNRLKLESDNLNRWFTWDWVVIAGQNGLVPGPAQSLGWKVAPAIGGDFSVANIQVFSRRVYLDLQGQLFRQIAAK